VVNSTIIKEQIEQTILDTHKTMKQYQKNGQIKLKSHIVIKRDGMQIINPSEELILADGWVEYVPPTPQPQPYQKSTYEIVEELVVKQWNDRTDISNNEALDYTVIVYPWSNYIGKTLQAGKIVSWAERLWRVRQEHTALEIYEPSLALAALYEVIEKEHSGEFNDPIPYTPPMEIFNGKYYIQEGVIYSCIRDSQIALTHNLSDLVGNYVIEVE
jgi:hypothetical protein